MPLLNSIHPFCERCVKSNTEEELNDNKNCDKHDVGLPKRVEFCVPADFMEYGCQNPYPNPHRKRNSEAKKVEYLDIPLHFIIELIHVQRCIDC